MTGAENQVSLQDLEEGENLRVWRARARGGLELLHIEGWTELRQEERKKEGVPSGEMLSAKARR